MEGSKIIINTYKRICEIKKKYGIYHKTLFHLHTPASYDYKLFGEWKHDDYLCVDENELIEYCLKRQVVPQRNILDDVKLDGMRGIYDSRTEWLAYILLANELLQNDYEIVVATDHNNIGGIEKLELAVKDIHNFKSTHPYPEIIWGVEVSCADKLHVVGIFDAKDKGTVQKWLDENLISEKDGTFRTSLDVMEFFKKEIDGISYIAHINSSQLFDGEKYLSGAYKKKLITAGCFEYIGVHERAHVKNVGRLLKDNAISTKGFVIDNDAHSIDEVGKNYFWIKSGKRCFKTLKEAFDDFEISVSLSNEIRQRKYIKGILIEGGGFLKGKETDDFSLMFSDSLNCFIGGRGTGKSTILQVLDYTLGLRVANESLLDFICNHGDIWVLFADGNKEYLIRMATPQKQNSGDNILRCFGQNEADLYNFRYHFSEDKVKDYVLKHFLSVYKIHKDKKQEEISVSPVSKYSTLSGLYDVRYSVNDLVQTASSNQIDDFIRQLMIQNKIISTPGNTIKCRSKNGLKQAIRDMQDLLVKRKSEVDEIVEPFNEKMAGVLRIVYSQDEPVEAPKFENWLFSGRHVDKKRDFKGIDITEENVVEYLYYVCGKVGIISLLKMALWEEDRYQFNISDFFKESRLDLSEQEQHAAIDTIFNSLITSKNYSQVILYLREMVKQSEKFSLEFNINNRTTAPKGVIYRDVRNLSLGQKVVAMLDFIFGYGDYIDDNRPILIDQPEDNLDSQYIYKNLVKQLRDIKDKRQIIIATHNATIVTNAMSDQVCVMCSDGKNGWIEKAGYPSEDAIKKDIVNYLEGGIDSFKHKIKVYEPVLKR